MALLTLRELKLIKLVKCRAPYVTYLRNLLKGAVKGYHFFKKLRPLRLAWPGETLVAAAMMSIAIFNFAYSVVTNDDDTEDICLCCAS